jgi:hypothetical protein
MKQHNLEQFRATDNAIYAWWVYRFARNAGEEIPAEVLKYLDDVADSVLMLASKHRLKAPMAPKKRSTALLNALGLSKSKEFNAYRQDQKQAGFVSEMEDSYCAWMEKYGDRRGWQDSELPAVAKQHNVSKSTARRVFDDYLKKERRSAKGYWDSFCQR